MNATEKQNNNGILKSSENNKIYFNSPSEFAHKNLFYPFWGGTFYCLPPYKIENDGDLDGFLLIYIIDGELHFTYRNHRFLAESGSVVLMDCLEYNMYYVENHAEFHWFHFNGGCSRAYFNKLYSECGPLYIKQFATEHFFVDIIDCLSSHNVKEELMSIQIQQILCRLSEYNSSLSLSAPIQKAKELIDASFNTTITVKDISSAATLSPYHFSRQFHAETGYSPHTYLMKVRLDYAKQCLSETDDPIDQISAECAFSSSSNFIRAFKQQVGITPHKFRQLAQSSNGLLK